MHPNILTKETVENSKNKTETWDDDRNDGIESNVWTSTSQLWKFIIWWMSPHNCWLHARCTVHHEQFTVFGMTYRISIFIWTCLWVDRDQTRLEPRFNPSHIQYYRLLRTCFSVCWKDKGGTFSINSVTCHHQCEIQTQTMMQLRLFSYNKHNPLHISMYMY